MLLNLNPVMSIIANVPAAIASTVSWLSSTIKAFDDKSGRLWLVVRSVDYQSILRKVPKCLRTFSQLFIFQST